MSKVSARRHHRTAVRASNREADAEIAWLSEEEKLLRNQIVDLERFIVKAPALAERAQSEQRERLNTLPPPDEFLDGDPDGAEADDFPLRRTRAQEAAARRHRAFNFLTCLAMAAVLAAFCVWLAENL